MSRGGEGMPDGPAGLGVCITPTGDGPTGDVGDNTVSVGAFGVGTSECGDASSSLSAPSGSSMGVDGGAPLSSSACLG